MTKATKTTAKAAKTTTAKPVATKKAASTAVAAKAVSVKAKAKKPAAINVDEIEGPVTLNVAFKKDLALTKRLERAAHKHGKAKVKAGICDMCFTFKRKSAFTKAVERIKERFGSDVTIAVAGAALAA